MLLKNRLYGACPGFPSNPLMQAILQAGNRSSFLESPWAPVAWYGGSAVAVGAPALAASAHSAYVWAASNPIAWKCLSDFVGGLFSPMGPATGATEEYPCGFFGQVISDGMSVPRH